MLQDVINNAIAIIILYMSLMLDSNQRELSFPVYKTGAIGHYANQASVVPMGLEPIFPGGLVSRTSVYANSTKGPKV